MPAFALSASLEEQLEDLAGEVRRLRIVRGICWLIAFLFAAPMCAIALDASFELPGRIRGALLVACAVIGVASAWWFVVRRFRETTPPEALARIIEAKFPSLAERLRTLVELSQHADAGNGSRTMMALLARETERRTKKLDFPSAAPTGFSIRVLGAVTVVAIFAVVSFAFVAGSGERVRRLVAPWQSTPIEQPYEVVVSSGDPVVKRGQSITVTGYLKRLQANAALPDSAAVVFREVGSDDEKKLPMVGDDKSAYALTRPTVAGDLEYCIESGAIRSDWHRISAVDPVEVAAGSEVILMAPAYAAALRPKRTIPSLVDIDALQHSRVSLKVKLTRPAQDVQLEWRPSDPKATVQRLAVQLDDARTSATAELPLRGDGTLKWVLFAEKDVRTEVVQTVRAIPDAPPKFERVAGLPDRARDIRPGEEITIDLIATDDVAVAQTSIEYGPADAVDESELIREPVTIASLGTGRVAGKLPFRLPSGAVAGRSYRVRLRITDNRLNPDFEQKPQSATYPDRGWAILRVSSSARPPAEQDIVAERERVRSKLETVEKLLVAAHADLKAHRLDFHGRPKLELDHSVRVTGQLDAVREALGLLEQLSRESIGALARELADRDVRTAEVQLKKVLNESNVTVRDTAALGAQHALEAALLKLAALKKTGETESKNALEQAQLEQLAKDQTKLAAEAKASKTPGDLAADQRKLSDELENLLRESEALKRGATDAETERLRKLTADLRDLTQTQKDLDAAIEKGQREANRDQIDELSKKQKALAEKIQRLAERTDLAARVAQTAPLEHKPAQTASDLLEKKKAIDALTEQAKAARDLDRLAESLEKSAAERSDTKKAAQQLARWQDDLQRRIADGLKRAPRGESPKDLEKWAGEQDAIRDATAKLQLPPSPVLDNTHQLAKDAAAGAAAELKRDPTKAADSIKKSAEALNLLAEKIPTQQQRLQAATLELEKLRKEQNAIAGETEDALRNSKSAEDAATAKRLAAAAEKQRDLAEKIEKLDAPGFEARRGRAADAGQRAKDELKKAQPKEIASSQQEVKHQLDRLKQAINGQKPVDEEAGELARLQKELTENLTKLDKPTVDDLQRLQRQQGDLAKKLQQMLVPEAQAPLNNARDAAQAAEAALKKPDSDIDELKKKSRQANAATQQLADELNKPVATRSPSKIDEPATLPNKNDAAEARELAKEQRDLREELARIAEKMTKPPAATKGDPLKQLAEAQEQLAKDAAQLAKDAKAVGQADAAAKAEEAAKKAHAAGKKLDVGDAAGARADADEARKKLAEAAASATKPEFADKANQLRAKQMELTDGTKPLADDLGSAAGRQRAKQRELAGRSRELADQLDVDKSAPEAIDGLKRAATAMEEANRKASVNKPGEAAAARRQAVEALAQAEKSLGADKPAPLSGATAEAARAAAMAGRQALDSMKQAEKDLGQPNGPGAAPAMQRAAGQLKRAADKLAEANKQSGEGTTGSKIDSTGQPTTQSSVPSAVSENLGKAWGELPGEVKSKITQELKAKYGDDYARLIKLYFEQLADRK